MTPQEIANPRLRAQFSPRPATYAAGDAQRARLQIAQGGMRWWSALAGLLGALAFTVMAARHTAAATAAAAAGGAATIPSGPNTPSQSLFTEQVSNDGGFLGAAPSGGGRSFRSSSS